MSSTYTPRHSAGRPAVAIVATVVAVLITLAAVITGATVATADAAHASGAGITSHRVRDIPTWVVTPCAADGDVDCRWDAHTMGDGTGHTYVVRELPGSAHMVCVFYVQPRYAATHDYCS